MADIADIAELKEQIIISLGDLSTRLEDAAIEFAANQAIDELGWSFPLPAGVKKFWGVQRGKRHAIDILCTTAAYKFKYKQISLNQRFDHLKALLVQMDEAWQDALKTDPALMDVADTFTAFGTYVGNGLIYDQHGRDISRVMKLIGEANEGFRERCV